MMEVLPATKRHAFNLAPRMRKKDAAECFAAKGASPLEALEFSLQTSEYKKAWLINGQVAAIWGVAEYPEAPGVGAAWLLTSDLVEQYPQAFMRLCRRELATMLGQWAGLVNAIDARYERAIEWAKRLGFHVHPAEPFGASGLLFHQISIGRN